MSCLGIKHNIYLLNLTIDFINCHEIINHMNQDWQALTHLSQGAPLIVERVRLKDSGIAIEGSFEPPPLASLSAEDQIFVAAFVRCHGSIKQMESFFGVSYPTIKNRLNRIGEQLPFAEIEPGQAPSADDLLSQLERGELTVREVIAQLRSRHADSER
jgi:hypothetical protein